MKKSVKKLVVNWKLFRGNSSTSDTIYEIAIGEIVNWEQWFSACWPEECKTEISRLKKNLLWKDLKKRAKSYCSRNF